MINQATDLQDAQDLTKHAVGEHRFSTSCGLGAAWRDRGPRWTGISNVGAGVERSSSGG
jgi:hypothetical protein